MSDAIASAAVAYVQCGWKVIQLHDVTAGQCSCWEGPACVSAGKHPLHKAWQMSFLGDESAVRAAWAARPQANVGIVTGPASGIWVLDVDPDHDGHVRLAELVDANGSLPQTHMVRTGSGGMHYYWSLAGADFDLTNSRGSLPVGLDVRGRGGFVVAPPSVSGRGPYAVLGGGAVSSGAGWLLAAVRPRPYVKPELPTGGEQREGHRYAVVSVQQILAEIGAMTPGGRNEGAFARACRLHELTNAEWSGLDFEQVQAGYLLACQQADSDPTDPFTYGEAWSVWIKAQRHVGPKAAILPPATHLGTPLMLPPDFARAGQGPATAEGGLTLGEPAPAIDPFEKAVRDQTWYLAAREEAARRLKAMREPPWSMDILDRARQREIGKVRPLIQGWLGWGQAARIYGPPGSGKSFAAVEMAACVSTGRAWHGRRVAAGEVLYVAAEDPAGITLRLQAWEQRAEIDHNVHMVSEELQMNAETVERILGSLRAYFAELPLALIVLDTQAMVTIGMEENSSTDMGLFVKAVKLMARETGACVLTVHHSGVRGGRARGSTSVLGAMDVEAEAAMTGTTMTLTGTKQKNLAKPLPLMLTLQTVDLGEFDDFGQQLTSGVLVAAGDPGTPLVLAGAGEMMSAVERRALAIATVLLETQASGETYSRVRTRAAQVTSFGTTPATLTKSFSVAWAWLIDRGRIAKAAGREAFYLVELDDGDRLAPNPGKLVQGGPEVYEG